MKTLLLTIAILLILNSCAAATTYATWIMVWYGHDQAWWKAGNADASKILINGKWKTLDWSDETQYGPILDGIRKAGVTVVIADLTNGWNWLDSRCQVIQRECAKRKMKFCIAENSGGNVAEFEKRAGDVWKNFAGPDAPNHDAYFHYRGKPLIVCYAIRDWYKSYINSKLPNRSRFSLVWASGEDSSINKWGWQLEPWVGSVPSTDSMYVTSAVRWNPADGDMWRKSIAWLDYNFALASKSKPEYVIVGAYDDPTERNTWLVSDTTHCEPGRQMRDKTGRISLTAHYDRVKQWTMGKPEVVPGGLLKDGAYRIINRSSGGYLGISNEGPKGQGAPGAAVETFAKPAKAPLGLFWLYHQGGNYYRIISLASGLPLDVEDKADGGYDIRQGRDTGANRQRWWLTKPCDGCFALTNEAVGESLSLDPGRLPLSLRPSSAADPYQQWRFEPVLTL